MAATGVVERPAGAPPGSDGDVEQRASGTRVLMATFTATAFVSAFLLFLVQPMVAKLVLPSYGGSPSVWNTAMLFFQAALLIGYGYAHVAAARLRPRPQARVHLLVIAAAGLALPIALPGWAAPSATVTPALWLLVVLVVMVGAPFVALSTTGPLLQRWFSLTDHPLASDPYFLYAASNAGSFLALLGYPLVVEPRLDVSDQTRLWSIGYGAFVVLMVVTVVVGRRHRFVDDRPVEVAGERSGLDLRRVARWVGLAFIPSSLMLGVTSYITTDLAAVPLLWVIPLAIYLATFVVAFGARRSTTTNVTACAALGLGVVAAAIAGHGVDAPIGLEIGAHLGLFTAVALLAHRRLAADRPPPAQLTAFYLAVAFGGVLGGVANALVAPLVFTRVLEYPLVLAAAVLLAREPIRTTVLARRYGRAGRLLEPVVLLPLLLVAVVVPFDATDVGRVLYLPALAVLVAALAWRWRGMVAMSTAVLLLVVTLKPVSYVSASRTFFGVYRVYRQDGQMVLEHGSTIHGREWLDADRRDEPIGYYASTSPIGQEFAANGPRLHHVAVIGLGVGTLAAYGAPDRHMTFYEIDPEVVRIARDSGEFHYLADSASPIDYVVGDGRLELAKAPAGVEDLIVLDAFSSDAIPVHLMTREAVAGYLTHLAEDGTIAFHISNNHLDLAPVLAGIAHDLGLQGRLQIDFGDAEAGALPSEWVVLGRTAAALGPIATDARWRNLDELPRQTWTDGYSNLLSVLK